MREIEVCVCGGWGGGGGTRKQATQRSNVGRARGDQFWQARHHFPAENFIEKHEKHEKQPLSRKISERKLKRASLYVEGIKEGKEKTRQFSNTKLIQVRVSF